NCAFGGVDMIIVKGKTHYTIVDAAERLGVSAKTIRDYIQRGIIPEPPEIKYGVRILKHFPIDYIDLAKVHLENYRNIKNEKRR
ncbi:MAG: MerR family transcriptional regulator, partial [Syntrophales bacterium]